MQIHFFSLICCLLYGFKLIERWLFKISHKNYYCDTQCTFERKRYNTYHGHTSQLVESSPFVFEFDHMTCSMYNQANKVDDVADSAIMMNEMREWTFVSYQENGRLKKSKYVHACVSGWLKWERTLGWWRWLWPVGWRRWLSTFDKTGNNWQRFGLVWEYQTQTV